MGFSLTIPSKAQEVHLPKILKRKCIGNLVRMGSIIIFHLSKPSSLYGRGTLKLGVKWLKQQEQEKKEKRKKKKSATVDRK